MQQVTNLVIKLNITTFYLKKIYIRVIFMKIVIGFFVNKIIFTIDLVLISFYYEEIK